MPPQFSAEEQRLLGSFSGPITRVPVSFGYRIALTAVALLMVLLPLIYLGITGLVAWAWWWYAVHGQAFFKGAYGTVALREALFGYVGPLVIGGVLVIFMFKPLFARTPKRARPMSVDERREPFLFAFVRQLCRSVGAPTPSRIDITCEVNASASFRHGASSMLGNDLVLTIGLPLVAGQSLHQFTGVLAHEFGHFAQGWAMRTSYIIHLVNHWFARVVYERDAWDELLVETASSDSHWALTIILQLARFCIWLTRRVLWLLMVIGHLFSSLLSRHMEFDADRHAARLVGREAFASALKELPVLGAAQAGAHQDLDHAWKERRLADDLPMLIQANVRQMSDELRKKIITHGLGESAGMYASHPATRDRVAAGDREPAQGVFHGDDGPARILFRDFAKLCRDTTLAWYQDEAKLMVQASNLVPTAHLIADYERHQADTTTARNLLGELWFSTVLFAPQGPAEPPVDPQALIKEAELAENRVIEARSKASFTSAGLPYHEPTEAMATVKERRQHVRLRLGKAASAAMERLASASGTEATLLHACLASLAKQQEQVDEAREGFAVLAAVLEHLDGHQHDEDYINHVRWELGQQRQRIVGLRQANRAHPYPFDHTQKDISIGDYLLTQEPAHDDLGQIMGASQQLLNNFYTLHHRALSRLAVLAQSGA